MRASLYIDNTNAVWLEDLYNKIDEQYEPTADVEVTLYDEDGQEVGGVTWPQSMNYVADTDATFVTAISPNASIERGKTYKAKIVALTEGGVTLTLIKTAKARERHA